MSGMASVNAWYASATRSRSMSSSGVRSIAPLRQTGPRAEHIQCRARYTQFARHEINCTLREVLYLRPRHGISTLTIHFRRVHGQVGLAENVVDVVAGTVERDPDARGDGDRSVRHGDRRLDGAHDPVREDLRVVRVGQPLDEHGKLVAAEARHGVADTHAHPQPRGDTTQHQVSGTVPTRVV